MSLSLERSKDMRHVNFSGIVLNGGNSSRMGTPKGEINFLGRPLIDRAVVALQESGASEIIVVGGSKPELATKELSHVKDMYPGEGPLGGVITGLLTAHLDHAVVLSNDLMGIDAGTIETMLGFSQKADLVVPVVEGISQVLSGLWKVSSVEALLEEYELGTRSLKSAIKKLSVFEIYEFEAAKFANANTPSDIIEYIAKLEENIE